jgi:hypothetical protein
MQCNTNVQWRESLKSLFARVGQRKNHEWRSHASDFWGHPKSGWPKTWFSIHVLHNSTNAANCTQMRSQNSHCIDQLYYLCMYCMIAIVYYNNHDVLHVFRYVRQIQSIQLAEQKQLV